MLQKTPTQICLKRLGFSLASRCSVCCQGEDSVPHLFFSSKQARSLALVILVCKYLPSFTLFASSIWQSLSSGSDTAGTRYMAEDFICVIYAIWKAINGATFVEVKVPLSRIQLQLQDTLFFSLKKISKPFRYNLRRSIFHFFLEFKKLQTELFSSLSSSSLSILFTLFYSSTIGSALGALLSLCNYFLFALLYKLPLKLKKKKPIQQKNLIHQA